MFYCEQEKHEMIAGNSRTPYSIVNHVLILTFYCYTVGLKRESQTIKLMTVFLKSKKNIHTPFNSQRTQSNKGNHRSIRVIYNILLIIDYHIRTKFFRKGKMQCCR